MCEQLNGKTQFEYVLKQQPIITAKKYLDQSKILKIFRFPKLINPEWEDQLKNRIYWEIDIEERKMLQKSCPYKSETCNKKCVAFNSGYIKTLFLDEVEFMKVSPHCELIGR